MSVARWCLVFAGLSVLASCLPPDKLSEDAFGAKKYGLPPVIHPGEYKELELTAGADTWVYLPAKAPNYYTVKQVGVVGVTVSVYHQDKTTPILLDVDPVDQPVFPTSLAENVFLKVTPGAIGSPTSYSLTCVPLVDEMLSPDVWRSASIDSDDTRHYGFPASAGTTYSISMNNGDDGDGTKSYYGGLIVCCSLPDGTIDVYNYLANTYWAYTTPITVVAPRNGLLVLIVGNGNSGTFALRVQQL